MRIVIALLGGLLLAAMPAHGRMTLPALVGTDLAAAGGAATPLPVVERKANVQRGWFRRAPVQAQRKPRQPRNDINATLEAMAIAKVGFSVPASSASPAPNH